MHVRELMLARELQVCRRALSRKAACVGGASTPRGAGRSSRGALATDLHPPSPRAHVPAPCPLAPQARALSHHAKPRAHVPASYPLAPQARALSHHAKPRAQSVRVRTLCLTSLLLCEPGADCERKACTWAACAGAQCNGRRRGRWL